MQLDELGSYTASLCLQVHLIFSLLFMRMSKSLRLLIRPLYCHCRLHRHHHSHHQASSSCNEIQLDLSVALGVDLHWQPQAVVEAPDRRKQTNIGRPNRCRKAKNSPQTRRRAGAPMAALVMQFVAEPLIYNSE